MIPKADVVSWRRFAPWVNDAQVEQDLIISRALVAIFHSPSHPSAQEGELPLAASEDDDAVIAPMKKASREIPAMPFFIRGYVISSL